MDLADMKYTIKSTTYTEPKETLRLEFNGITLQHAIGHKVMICFL